MLALPLAAYSVVADHSGLCLDILNDSTDTEEIVQKFPLNGASSHLWAFVPDKKGFNFIVNLCSGRVLDVADNSLKICGFDLAIARGTCFGAASSNSDQRPLSRPIRIRRAIL